MTGKLHYIITQAGEDFVNSGEVDDLDAIKRHILVELSGFELTASYFIWNSIRACEDCNKNINSSFLVDNFETVLENLISIGFLEKFIINDTIIKKIKSLQPLL